VDRRRFLKWVMGSIATVAISMRVAQGAPSLLSGGSSWVFEKCGKFIYGIDLVNPLDVAIYFSDFNHPLSVEAVNLDAQFEHYEMEKAMILEKEDADKLKQQYIHHSMCADDIHSRTTRYARAVYRPLKKTVQTDFLELCAVIGMSQSFAEFKNTGMVADTGSEVMGYADIPLVQIRTIGKEYE